MQLESGNSFSIVFTIYVAILLPWAFLYLHDFISERWQTIKHTAMNGLLHLTVAVIPLPYILYYIILQARLDDPDYKEMFAAITAVIFNLYHILRTTWGLFQLYYFRQWAIRTAIVFESASYTCAFNPSPDRLTPPKQSKFRFPRSPNSCTHSDSPQPLDPSTIESGTASPPHLTDTCSAHHKHANAHAVKKQRQRIASHINLMEVNSSIIDNEIINSYAPWRFSSPSRLRPRHRRSTVTHWIVAYLAQFGGKWLEDCKTIQSDPGQSWKQKKRHFAVNVWATAALRMANPSSKPQSYPQVHEQPDAMRSFLPPHILAKISSANKSQVFSKQQILKRCMSTGDALPFSCPILDSSFQPLPSHGSYMPLIKESIESLPSRLYENVEKLNPEQVEWFIVFIWVGEWGDCPSFPSNPDTDSQASVKKQRKKKLSRFDTPVRVLQDQLGLDTPPSLDTCGFPILHRGYGNNLWNNRTILEVSARIDNWIALHNGVQLNRLLKRETELSRHMFEKENESDFPSSTGPSILKVTAELNTPEQELSEVFKCHRDLETRCLRYQLANNNTLHKHLEQGLTFMGCVVESVRSGIAEQFHYLSDFKAPFDERQKLLNGDHWTPEVPKDSVTFRISCELWECLQKIEEKWHPIDSTLEERLLWECQDGIHSSFSHRIKKEPASKSHETVEAMLLCLLGFPSIQVERRGRKYYEEEDSESLAYYYLRPVGGPQAFDVSVRVWKASAYVSVSVTESRDKKFGDEEERKFCWQDWRDAFEGRLIADAVWQKSHFMRDVRMHHTLAPISLGVIIMDIGEASDERKALFWGGWRPFRAGIPLFELKHSSLIIVGDKMPTDVHLNGGHESSDGEEDRNVNSESDGHEAYNFASAAALSDASLHLNALLKLNSSIFRNERDLREGIEPEDPAPSPIGSPPIPMSFPAPVSPSSSSDERSIKFVFAQSAPLPQETVLRAQEQDHIAMHHLAKWLLAGSNGFRRNKQKALLLMERALVLGRRVETAKLLLKALLESWKIGEEEMQRSLQAVELLWQDMRMRSQMCVEGDEERERMGTIVNLHEKVVKMGPEGKLICGLADRISKWGKTREEEGRCMLLYECAIIAGDSGGAMRKLGRKYEGKNEEFASALLNRAEGERNALIGTERGLGVS